MPGSTRTFCRSRAMKGFHRTSRRRAIESGSYGVRETRGDLKRHLRKASGQARQTRRCGVQPPRDQVDVVPWRERVKLAGSFKVSAPFVETGKGHPAEQLTKRIVSSCTAWPQFEGLFKVLLSAHEIPFALHGDKSLCVVSIR